MSKEVAGGGAQPSPPGVSGVQGRAGGRAGRPRGDGAGVVPRGPTRQEERGVLAAGPPHAAAGCSLLPESCRCRSRRARSESVGVSERMWEGHRQHWLRLHFRAEAPSPPGRGRRLMWGGGEVHPGRRASDDLSTSRSFPRPQGGSRNGGRGVEVAKRGRRNPEQWGQDTCATREGLKARGQVAGGHLREGQHRSCDGSHCVPPN